MAVAPGLLIVEVSMEGPQHLTDALGKITVLEPHAKFVIRDFAENRDRVVVKVLPAAW